MHIRTIMYIFIMTFKDTNDELTKLYENVQDNQ